MQEYTTIKAVAKAEICEKHSRFIATVAPADSEEKALAFLAQMRKKYSDATHNVYAYSLRQDNRQRYSDDGEPSKTAGFPVLEVISHSGINDIIIVVTRYFGGTLLGTGGLVRAYTAAAKAALEAAQKAVYRPCVRISLSADYSLHDSISYALQACGADNISIEYSEKLDISFTVLSGTEQKIADELSLLTKGGKTEISPEFYALV